MSPHAGSITQLFLQVSIAASAIGAFVGGYTLMHPMGSGALTGLSPDPASPTGVRALGGAMLLAHAAALAALGQAPGIGSCMAAGLGTAWFGAAAGRGIAVVVERGHTPKALLRMGWEGAMGAVLWAPLWNYLRLIRHGALRGAI